MHNTFFTKPHPLIFYLIYVSSATDLYTNADFSDILSSSRFNNKLNNITGILLYHEGNILQVLEGDRETVMNLYDKIKLDSRHDNGMKMISGTSDERNFPDWLMGFKTLTGSEWDEYAGYLELDPSNLVAKLKHTNMKIDTMVNSFITTVNLRR